MSNRRIEMYEYRQVIYRMRQGDSDRSIARDRLIGRIKAKLVRHIANINGWLDKDKPLPDDQALKAIFEKSEEGGTKEPLKVAPYREQIEQWVDQGVSATIIYHKLVDEFKFSGSYNCVQRYIKKYKSVIPKTTVPLIFNPGEAVQVDFGQGPKVLDPKTGELKKTWFFVMTLCWSRHQYVELVFSQDVQTWLGCHRRAFEWFNGVPKKIIIDNPKCAITKACYYQPTVQRSYHDFAQDYGFIVSACPPRDPKKKGRVESGVKYVKRNFMPLRVFKDITDANHQLKSWILETAGNRIHGTTQQKPLSQFEAIEKATLKPLPSTPPELCVWEKVKLYSDCHVRFEKCRYSAPHTLINEVLWLKATEGTVRIYHKHEVVAIHQRINMPDIPATALNHLPPKAKAFLEQTPQWCREKAQVIGTACNEVIELLLNDPAVDYLRAAQGIIHLSRQYGKPRLEAACKRALAFESVSISSIKKILAKGLDAASLGDEEVFEALGKAYCGEGRFCRSAEELTH